VSAIPRPAGGATAALLALILAGVAPAAPGAELTPGRIARLDSAVTAVIARNHIPGLSIAVAAGGAIRWEKAYGLADVENGVPATTRTIYRIASTSKPLTAVAALRLAEAGKLDLDAPIQTYAPTFPAKGPAVTARALLGHLAGIRHYRRGEPERTDHFETLTAALAVFADDSLEHAPGARYTYTTFGYTLLGVAIEGAAGRDYAGAMRELVFEPAGMTETRIDDVAAIVPHRARGYSPLVYARFDGTWRNARLMDASYKLPGGGLLSTAGDLARFALALEDGKLLGEEMRRAMAVSGRTSDGAETGYGYGWYVERLDGPGGELVLHHGGVQAGFTGELWTLPRRRFAVAILTNLEGGGGLGLAALARDLARVVLGPGYEEFR
jgi:CubicO group peptidase (beta-lactamase class C family)